MEKRTPLWVFTGVLISMIILALIGVQLLNLPGDDLSKNNFECPSLIRLTGELEWAGKIGVDYRKVGQSCDDSNPCGESLCLNGICSCPNANNMTLEREDPIIAALYSSSSAVYPAGFLKGLDVHLDNCTPVRPLSSVPKKSMLLKVCVALFVALLAIAVYVAHRKGVITISNQKIFIASFSLICLTSLWLVAGSRINNPVTFLNVAVAMLVSGAGGQLVGIILLGIITIAGLFACCLMWHLGKDSRSIKLYVCAGYSGVIPLAFICLYACMIGMTPHNVVHNLPNGRQVNAHLKYHAFGAIDNTFISAKSGFRFPLPQDRWYEGSSNVGLTDAKLFVLKIGAVGFQGSLSHIMESSTSLKGARISPWVVKIIYWSAPVHVTFNQAGAGIRSSMTAFKEVLGYSNTTTSVWVAGESIEKFDGTEPATALGDAYSNLLVVSVAPYLMYNEMYNAYALFVAGTNFVAPSLMTGFFINAWTSLRTWMPDIIPQDCNDLEKMSEGLTSNKFVWDTIQAWMSSIHSIVLTACCVYFCNKFGSENTNSEAQPLDPADKPYGYEAC